MADLTSGLQAPSGGGLDVYLPTPDPKAMVAQAFGGGPQQQQSQSQPAVPEWFRPIAQQIRSGEGTAGGSGMLYYGGKPIENPGHDFPQWEGAQGPSGQPTHAAGPGQFQPGTWAIEVKRAKAQGFDLDFSNPAHQDWAMFDRASQVYKDRTGHSLEQDKANGTVNMAALSQEWQGLGSHDRAAVARELQDNTTGAFNGSAREFVGAMMKSMQSANERYDNSMKRAEKFEDFAMAEQQRA